MQQIDAQGAGKGRRNDEGVLESVAHLFTGAVRNDFGGLTPLRRLICSGAQRATGI